MNKRKISLLIASIVITILLMIIPNKVAAVTTHIPPLYFGVKEFRDGTSPQNLAYAIRNPYDNGSTTASMVGAKIWQIVKYNSNIDRTYTTGNYYCVRAGVGFSDVTNIAPYTISYDLKAERNVIAMYGNNTLKKIINNGYFNNLLALTDLVYLKGESSIAERTALLEAAGIYADNYEYLLTDSDIEAVQQAAMWYFTNHDDATFSQIYDNFGLNKTSWLFYRTLEMSQKGEKYTSLSDYNLGRNEFGGQSGEGLDRQEQAVLLYNYLINTANVNAITYANGTAVSRTKVTLYANATQENTQPIILIEKKQEIPGNYGIVLVKQDAEGRQLNSQATFEINGVRRNVVGTLQIATDVPITSQNVYTTDTYIIKEIIAPNGYCKFDGVITLDVTKKYENGIYKLDRISHRVSDENGNDITAISRDFINISINQNGNIYVEVKNYQNNGKYDLILVKEDEKGEQLNSKATFEVNQKTIDVTGRLQIASNVEINSSNVSSADIYVIKELVPPDEYCKFDGIITVTVTKTNENGTYKIGNVSYKVTDANGKDITSESKSEVNVYLNENGNIYVEVKNHQNNGNYNVTLVKQDEKGEQLNSKATFEVNQKTIEVTGRLQIANNVEINSSNVSKADTYVIKELIAPDKYCKFDGIITITVNKKNENGTFKLDNISYKVTDSNGKDITNDTKNSVNVYLNQDGNIYVEVKNYQFDLKLIKRIAEINGVKVTERIEDIDITNLKNGTATTAKYTLNKTPLAVKNGDIIKYTLRVYNEGDVDGYASEITEDIPVGLELLWSEKTGDELEQDTTLSALEKEAIRYNQLIWNFKRVNSTTNKPELISTDYLAKGKGQEIANDGANLIKAFDSSKEYKNTINDKNPDYKEVSVYLKVAASNDISKIIRNEAAITGDTDKDGNQVTDRDSKPEDWVKYEDDEDYDNVILESFDLSLRKFIVAVSKDTTIEDDEYLKDSNGTYTRAPIVDTSKLNTIGEDGKKITTAIYNHTKTPIEVAKKDIVVYMIRVYNEGDIDGYASEITDHLPPYLEYVDSEFNKKYGWEVSENGRTVKTAYLDNHLISKTTTNSKQEIVLSYKEVPIMCKVTDKAEGKITNIADITISKDGNKQLVEDRDSEEKNVVLPEDSELPNYKDDEKGNYIPGQEDDDDFEKLIVKKFDLALRKFITEVTGKEVTTRIPKVNYNSETKKITYEHTKEPVDVTTGDVVVYTIRVYNEGEINGFASEITDDIPDGLSYLPENELNKEYRWVMYDKDGNKTEDISKAVKIKTDYLSKEVLGEDALLKAFDETKEISDSNPDYADVKVAFKVVEPTTSDRIIVNSAQISNDTDEDGNSVDDEDSIPDEWNDGEDDQDKEYIKLNYFDLALRKWVTQAIVIEDGKEVVTQTGHKPEDDPEQVVKVEIHRKKIDSVIVKFKYSIRVTNEGDIAGYAKEITDYVPQGLKFEQADNKEWKDEGNNVISTKALENKLLQPGESAEVEVVLTWINGKDNMGLKVNVAEISEDYNDKDVPDKDSVPDNQIPGEDDQDDAPVLLTVSTGQTRIYYTLGFVILITIAGGIVLIKKFVL